MGENLPAVWQAGLRPNLQGLKLMPTAPKR